MPHEQRLYGTHEFGAEKKMMTRFVLIRSENGKPEEMWVEKVVFLFC